MSFHGLQPRTLRMIGLALLVAFPLVVVVGWKRPFHVGGPSMTDVRAVFDSAHGISRVGNDVRMGGARIGKIKDIDRVGEDALITMHVERDSARELRQDARAELRPRFAFEGTAFIELIPGSRSGSALGGATIPLAHTSTYVPLDQALKVLRPQVRGQARSTVKKTQALLQDDAIAAAQSILHDSSAVSRRLAPGMRAAAGPHRTELAGSVAGMSRTLDALAHEERALSGFMGATEQTMAAFDTDAGRPLSATLRTAPAALTALRTGSTSLHEVLDGLDPLVTDIRPGLRALPPTLRRARVLLHDAPGALRSATPVVTQLRSAVEAGAAATSDASRLLAAIPATTKVLNTSLLPALLAPTPDLHIPAYLSVLGMLEGGAGAFAPYQTPAQAKLPPAVGAGHFVRFDGRFYAAGGAIPVPPCTLLQSLRPELVDTFAKAGMCVR